MLLSSDSTLKIIECYTVRSRSRCREILFLLCSPRSRRELGLTDAGDAAVEEERKPCDVLTEVARPAQFRPTVEWRVGEDCGGYRRMDVLQVCHD